MLTPKTQFSARQYESSFDALNSLKMPLRTKAPSSEYSYNYYSIVRAALADRKYCINRCMN